MHERARTHTHVHTLTHGEIRCIDCGPDQPISTTFVRVFRRLYSYTVAINHI